MPRSIREALEALGIVAFCIVGGLLARMVATVLQ